MERRNKYFVPIYADYRWNYLVSKLSQQVLRTENLMCETGFKSVSSVSVSGYKLSAKPSRHF